MPFDAKIPPGPIAQKWAQRRYELRLVNPANRRHHTVIVVATGLAGAAGAASLGEPDAIADTVLATSRQARSAWSFEVEARPFGESW